MIDELRWFACVVLMPMCLVAASATVTMFVWAVLFRRDKNITQTDLRIAAAILAPFAMMFTVMAAHVLLDAIA